MKNYFTHPQYKISDSDSLRFEEFLQERINRLCGMVRDPWIREHRPNFFRIAIVTKHALIDFARILKGRQSAQESLWKGGPNERNNALLLALKQELIGCGLRPPDKERK